MTDQMQNNSQYWLCEIERHLGHDPSNAQIAELLGITRGAISHQKLGRYAMSVRAAVATAYLLEIHPMLLVASTQYDSATTEPDKIFWLTTYMKWADKAPRKIRPPIAELIPPQP